MTLRHWNDPDHAWANAQRLSNREDWTEYIDSLELADDLPKDIIREYVGSQEDLKLLRTLQAEYSQVVTCLEGLLVRLAKDVEEDGNLKAVENLLEMRTRYRDIRDMIDGFLAGQASRTAKVKAKIDSIANGREDVKPLLIPVSASKDAPTPVARPSQSSNQSPVNKRFMLRSLEDLREEELSCKEVATACRLD